MLGTASGQGLEVTRRPVCLIDIRRCGVGNLVLTCINRLLLNVAAGTGGARPGNAHRRRWLVQPAPVSEMGRLMFWRGYSRFNADASFAGRRRVVA
jgi:hypothetical protein